jgi:serine/threonine-protein kinase RsbT
VSPPAGPAALRVTVGDRADVETARRRVRELAAGLGFGAAEAEAVALAAAELASNLARYAPGGVLAAAPVYGPRGTGVQLVSRDAGPGIPDLDRALQDGYSTSGGLGSGLPAVRRLMDEFEADGGPGGTTIVARKWRRTGGRVA